MKSEAISLHKYLINRSQAGDQKAQYELYNLYAAAMYNICRRMMGNDDDAKDVLQDSFIQAFTKLNTLKKEELFPAWIKRIVVNRCLNQLQKSKVFKLISDEELEISPDECETEEEKEYQVDRIKKAMDQISEGCRTVLNLYVFEGYDHKEISEILSISESASKAQYSKAKSKIRSILNQV
ncbi:MAG: DNA-directed RNA polymerase sigma-70 factor [Cyclobacteriaceae bacterium]|nr:MAG: DNA-directed RNA polymerase sigma-70 factor [Cyclobacteriaceae bacterium]